MLVNSRLKISVGKLTTSALFYFKMSRPIKFRVWNTKEKKYFIQGDNQRIDLSLEYFELTKHVCWPEQFTGLKDKNGKDIYDGDVMQWEEGEIGVVKYEANACQFRIEISEGVSMHIGLNTAGKGTAVVIGTIHENPELLNT